MKPASKKNANAQSVNKSSTTTKSRRENHYSVTVQIQGKGLTTGNLERRGDVRNLSQNIQSKEPIPGLTVRTVMEGLLGQLNGRDQVAAFGAYTDARSKVLAAEEAGGISGQANLSGTGDGRGSYIRVDVEINSGDLNLVP